MARSKTDIQILREKVSKYLDKLPELTPKQEKFMYRNLPIYGKISNGNHCQCLSCGHKWADPSATTERPMTCPNCGDELTMQYKRNSRRVNYRSDGNYSAIVTTFRGLQVIRFFQSQIDYRRYRRNDVTGRYEDGQFNVRVCFEVGQIWMDEKGNDIVARKTQNMMNYYTTRKFYQGGTINIMKRREVNDILRSMSCDVYPIIRVIPNARRNGYHGSFEGLSPYDFLYNILKYNIMETLYKVGRVKDFTYMSSRAILDYKKPKDREQLAKSLKITIRHKYEIKHLKDWIDMVTMGNKAGVDMLNPLNVCPENFWTKHDEILGIYHRNEQRIRQQEAHRRWLEQLEESKKDEESYRKDKSKYFSLDIHDDKGLQITVLPTVESFFEEGEAMHHCVAACHYYNKKSSLILSARVNGERAETIELSLKDYTIIQSRGVCNGQSPYHSRILALMKKHIPEIKRLA